MDAQTCFSSDQLLEYARCSCSKELSQQIESHLEQCETCQTQFAQVVDAGAAPSFMRLGRNLNRELAPTLAATTDQIHGDSTIATYSPRTIPEAIGQYRVTGYIGGGGMGVVYSAWDELLKRPVALKLLHRQDEKSSRSMRMLQEAAALGRLSHPNIVSIYEVLSHESQPVLSMELVEGQNLANWLDGRRVDPKSAAEVVLKLAGALHYAHSKGVVHRDLKPANVLLELVDTQSVDVSTSSKRATQSAESGTATGVLHDLANYVPKIADFGLAKLMDETAMTNTGDVLGTPAYMAPEQAKGQSSTEPSVDIYALGVILYELLTGRQPFVADSPIQTMSLVLNSVPVSTRTLIASVPRDLDTICLKCLEKRPADRYTSMTLLANDLGAFLEGRPVAARPIGAWSQGVRWALRNPMMASMMAACGLMLVAITVGSVLFAAREYNLRTELIKKDKEKEATRIEGLVGRLVSAEPNQLTQIVKELDENASLSSNYLSPMLASQPVTAADKRAQLHARIASVSRDASIIEPLIEEMLTGKLAYVVPIRDQLLSQASAILPQLKALLKDDNVDSQRRFRAALGVAGLDAGSDPLDWSKSDLTFIAEQLVDSNSELQPQLRDALRPIGPRLLDALYDIFVSPDALAGRKESTVNAFADFSSQDDSRLVQWLLASSPEQLKILSARIPGQLSESATKYLKEVASSLLVQELSAEERVAFGRRRANAAFILLRLGERKSALRTFDLIDDCEALTQFVCRCRDSGVSVEELIALLEEAQASGNRKYVAQAHRHIAEIPRFVEDSYTQSSHRLYGLLLSLGQFKINEVPEDRRASLVALLIDLYGHDPSSSVHGAAGWLLRHWGERKDADLIDQTPVPYSTEREWFTLVATVIPNTEIPNTEASASGDNNDASAINNVEKKTRFFTFVVFNEGDYEVDKKFRRRVITMPRPFALLDRELTKAEYMLFKPVSGRTIISGSVGQVLKCAETGISWYEAVSFCRWLGSQLGVAEAEQPYADPKSLDESSYRRDQAENASWAPYDWPLQEEKGGFRLPTEAEWEIACCGGSMTLYSFGSDPNLLRYFAWYRDNCGEMKVHPPKKLFPNARGMFDTHGNAKEWVHDWEGAAQLYAAGSMKIPPGHARMLRGGGYNQSPEDCWTFVAASYYPASSSASSGLRLAITPSSFVSSAPASAPASAP